MLLGLIVHWQEEKTSISHVLDRKFKLAINDKNKGQKHGH